MMEQQDHADRELACKSSDAVEEEVIDAKLFQKIRLTDLPGLGTSEESRCVCDMSWNSAGNSLAVAFGKHPDKKWRGDKGLIRIFTLRRAAGDTFVRTLDLTEKSRITKVKYHHSVSALLAYGTKTGEVVLCDQGNLDAMMLTCPAGAHGSKRVSNLQWADATLANTFLTMHIMNTGKSHDAADHILISSGFDGTVNVWRVNSDQKIFENVISYSLFGSKKNATVNITCFDFVRSYPLRPNDKKAPDHIFVVGTRCGSIDVCKTKTFKPIVDSTKVDPVYKSLESHGEKVLDVAFSFQKPRIFVSASLDSELRVYDIKKPSPLKVIKLDVSISCMTWLPNNPCVAILGLTNPEGQLLQVFNVNSGGRIPVEGLTGDRSRITCITVTHSGVCRIAAADADSNLHIWELPTRHFKLTQEELVL